MSSVVCELEYGIGRDVPFASTAVVLGDPTASGNARALTSIEAAIALSGTYIHSMPHNAANQRRAAHGSEEQIYPSRARCICLLAAGTHIENCASLPLNVNAVRLAPGPQGFPLVLVFKLVPLGQFSPTLQQALEATVGPTMLKDTCYLLEIIWKRAPSEMQSEWLS